MEAISEDEGRGLLRPASNVTAEKLKITLNLGAGWTAAGGCALLPVPDVHLARHRQAGISVSLQMVFAVIVGGVYVSLGPTVGAIHHHPAWREILRIGFGHQGRWAGEQTSSMA